MNKSDFHSIVAVNRQLNSYLHVYEKDLTEGSHVISIVLIIKNLSIASCTLPHER